MAIHRNSRESNWRTDHSRREQAVMAVLARSGRPMTDREICTALGSADLNYARPTVTTLKQSGRLREVGDVTCPVTGRTVRTVWFAERQLLLHA